MATIRLIKRRIKSAQNIAKITQAMEMVAASKMKKAQELAIAGKPYAEKIHSAVQELVKHIDPKAHPLLSPGNDKGKNLVVVISTNKGLCGGLNTNLFRMILGLSFDKKDTDFVTVGKKGESFVVRGGNNLIADFSDKIPFKDSVPALAQFLVDGFLTGKFKGIYLVYNTFVSALKQIPSQKMIIPIGNISETSEQKEVKFSEFILEPSRDGILESLLPHYIENQLRAAIYEAEASEHSARMIAMKNATDAALDFVSSLTLVYNKIRQEKITSEIADMVTARMAVE